MEALSKRPGGWFSGSSTSIDGQVGFATNVPWDFNPSDGISAGQEDFNAVALCMRLLMRWAASLNPITLQVGLMGWTCFDFASAGHLQLTQGQTAYFSTDGGTTNLNFLQFCFPTIPTSGPRQSVGILSGYGSRGVLKPMSSVDLREMDVLGYTLSSAGNAIVHTITSNTPNATIAGSSSDDVIQALGGDATVTGGGGNDTIVFGPGVNTAVYSGSHSQYTVTGSSASMNVVDTVTGRDGSDVLSNVQELKFSDGTLVFDLQSGQDKLVYELYQAAYARTPDLNGFRYWSGVADANHTSAMQLADQYLAAPEFTQRYGHPDNSTYVTELYTNVLGRTPDSGGLAYWIGNANSGEARDQLLVDFATSNENQQLIAPHITNGFLLA